MGNSLSMDAEDADRSGGQGEPGGVSQPIVAASGEGVGQLGAGRQVLRCISFHGFVVELRILSCLSNRA
jgi:hypothetical protein